MIKHIEPDYAPLGVLSEIPERNLGGMSESEMAFLCGAVRRFRPRKVVEVGVAAGVTTVVILEALMRNGECCQFYSVDLCQRYYKDTFCETGYVATNWLKNHGDSKVRHKMILGLTVAEAMDQIGSGIDFVILDTMHSLPGELLDFLSVYPFITNDLGGGTVVFHDVAQSQLGIGGGAGGAPFQYASLVTMLAAGGEKFWLHDEGNVAGFGNIGAVHFCKNATDCWDYAENLFMALRLNWNYMPDSNSMNAYKERILKNYGDAGRVLLDEAIELNEFSLYRQNKIKIDLRSVRKGLFYYIINNKGKVYVYGDGRIANEVKDFMIRNKKDIAGYVVTRRTEKSNANTIDVIEFAKKYSPNEDTIILGLDEQYHEQVIRSLYSIGAGDNVYPRNGVGFREMLRIIRYENDLHNSVDSGNLDGYASAIERVALGVS